MWRLVLTVSLLCCSSEGKVSCRDKDGKEVDWYILYKTPRNPQLTGLDYIYIYPDAKVGVTFQRNDQNKNIASPKGVLANTLQPLFYPPKNFGYISYSDQPPEYLKSASPSHGHSKGVVMVQKNGKGVWLLHSTPKFPYAKDQKNFWPKSGARNAQIFICVTFNYDQFEHIGKHLQLINVYPFMSDIPSDFHKTLQEVKNGDTKIHSTPKIRRVAPTFQQLISSGGKDFGCIAKQVSADGNPKVGDLYVSISEELKSDVNVQSWGCQQDRDVSFCSPNKRKVQNILFVKTVWGKWDSGSDHSKWCVAVDQNKPWTCIADVNRSESQYKRLGGALCINDKEVTNIFKGFADYEEKC